MEGKGDMIVKVARRGDMKKEDSKICICKLKIIGSIGKFST